MKSIGRLYEIKKKKDIIEIKIFSLKLFIFIRFEHIVKTRRDINTSQSSFFMGFARDSRSWCRYM